MFVWRIKCLKVGRKFINYIPCYAENIRLKIIWYYALLFHLIGLKKKKFALLQVIHIWHYAQYDVSTTISCWQFMNGLNDVWIGSNGCCILFSAQTWSNSSRPSVAFQLWSGHAGTFLFSVLPRRIRTEVGLKSTKPDLF